MYVLAWPVCARKHLREDADNENRLACVCAEALEDGIVARDTIEMRARS